MKFSAYLESMIRRSSLFPSRAASSWQSTASIVLLLMAPAFSSSISVARPPIPGPPQADDVMTKVAALWIDTVRPLCLATTWPAGKFCWRFNWRSRLSDRVGVCSGDDLRGRGWLSQPGHSIGELAPRGTTTIETSSSETISPTVWLRWTCWDLSWKVKRVDALQTEFIWKTLKIR